MNNIPDNPIVFIIIFALGWTGVLFIISILGGWGKLASYYPYTGQSVDRKLHLQSGRFGRFTGYNNCLSIGASPEGLYIAVLFFFRPGHPPMFIPWHEIKAKRTKVWGFPVLELRFERSPATGFICPVRLERFLNEASGGQLPAVDVSPETKRASFLEAFIERSSTFRVVGYISFLIILGVILFAFLRGLPAN